MFRANSGRMWIIRSFMQDDYHPFWRGKGGVAPTGHANFQDKMKSQVISQCGVSLCSTCCSLLVDALALLSLSFCPSRTQTDSERMPPRFRVIDSGVASVPLIGSLPPCQSDRRRLIIINARESGRTGILQGLVAESALERNAISIINLQSTGQAYKVCYRKTCKR